LIAFCEQEPSYPTIGCMVDSMFTAAFSEVVTAVIAMRKGAGLTQRQLAAAGSGGIGAAVPSVQRRSGASDPQNHKGDLEPAAAKAVHNSARSWRDL